jgi:hypothetical protein
MPSWLPFASSHISSVTIMISQTVRAYILSIWRQQPPVTSMMVADV